MRTDPALRFAGYICFMPYLKFLLMHSGIPGYRDILNVLYYYNYAKTYIWYIAAYDTQYVVDMPL